MAFPTLFFIAFSRIVETPSLAVRFLQSLEFFPKKNFIIHFILEFPSKCCKVKATSIRCLAYREQFAFTGVWPYHNTTYFCICYILMTEFIWWIPIIYDLGKIAHMVFRNFVFNSIWKLRSVRSLLSRCAIWKRYMPICPSGNILVSALITRMVIGKDNEMK